MSKHAEPRRRRSTAAFLRSARTRAVLSLGIVLGFGAVSTMAFWTDTATVSTGSIESGSMDMQFDTNGAIGLGTGYAKSQIAWSDLTPGESKAFNLLVRNVGDPTFTYTATVTRGATPAWTYIGTPITVRFFTGTASSDTTYPQQESCSGTPLGAAQSVDATNKPLITGPPSIVGNGSQQICMVIGIDAAASNDNQGRTGSLAFQFTATQAMP